VFGSLLFLLSFDWVFEPNQGLADCLSYSGTIEVTIFLYCVNLTPLYFFKCKIYFKQAGLSMALGAFLAGLLLAETEFSLQVESDIAPYRGLLLGLFFMTVGA
jgi:hypothetical protein